MQELEDLPDFADDFATDLSGLPEQGDTTKNGRPSAHASGRQLTQATPVREALPTWATAQLPVSDHDLQQASELAAIASTHQESLLDKSRRVLRNILLRRTQQEAIASSHSSTGLGSTAIMTEMPSTMLHPEDAHQEMQWLPDDEAREVFEQEQLAHALKAQLQAAQFERHDADRANIELLQQTRVKPLSADSAVEHLLELRTAVSRLTVLGRPEAALVLLYEHIEAHVDTCAWAYLEYMQLCEQLELREDFESMRKKYRLQFNRMAPYWHEPNANVLGLVGYSRAASELCAAWAQGTSAAHDVIAAWLIGSMLGRKLVQLPAYHDLFDLFELLETRSQLEQTYSSAQAKLLPASAGAPVLLDALEGQPSEKTDDFVPTVSLLDLDYEFSSDVTLEEKAVKEAERSVTIVKPGNFSVDFNVAGTQLGGLFSVPAELDKK